MDMDAIRERAERATREAAADDRNAEYGPFDPTRDGVREYRPEDIELDSIPMATDLVTFWIWMDPGSGDDLEAAKKAIEFTGE